MHITDGKIGAREQLAVATFLIAMKVSDTTPDILIHHAMNAAWLVSLINGLVVLIPLLLILHLLKRYQTGLYDLLLTLTGRWGSTLIMLFIFLWLFISTFVNSRSYIDIVNTLFFPQTSIEALYVLFLLFCALVSIRGFETLGRMSWLLFWLIAGIVILLLLTTWQHMKISQLFPLLGPGLDVILLRGVTHSSLYVELFLIAFFFPYTTSYKALRDGVWIGFAVSALMLIVFNAVYVMVFDYPAIASMPYPYQQLTRSSSLFGMEAHMDALFLGVWIIAAILHFALYLYILAYLFARLFKIQEFEMLIIPMTGLVLYIGMIQENVMQMIFLRDVLMMTTSIFYLLLPFGLWILHLWRRRKVR
ncbi:hypothetical protein PRECH8_27840 [Insulibacter thermoxylanivorax]|uniref:Spore germination protein (Amino acid permease) n=1 Tax=Insulibacter thermoxylanivorax TaxID=2749268 RepID=A0A916VGY4_9BACL|nr:endospore germination permease [Insulibacter thermoxylanivorax]GFR39488.1 hypothetical protein PRECH8_27840 [Insulibacter thermoxylanivorax]